MKNPILVTKLRERRMRRIREGKRPRPSLTAYSSMIKMMEMEMMMA